MDLGPNNFGDSLAQAENARHAAPVTGVSKKAARARISARGLELGRRTVALYSGEIHYFQHDSGDWPALLDRVKELGLSGVSSYLPWGVHEIGEGRFDFGETRAKLDVGAFAKLVAERELFLILRPGPHINAELNWLGYPKRVLSRDAVMARTPGGNPLWLPIAPKPMPIPSYASEVFLEEVDRWLSAVAERLVSLQWPEGPLVALQLDNEAPLVFRNSPFEQDYHPDAVAIYRELAERRGRPRREPPTELEGDDRESLLTVLDWLASRHEVYGRALRRMRATLESAGLDRVAYYHNIAQEGALPEVSPETFDAVDAVGYDFYHERRFLELLLDRAAYVVGSTPLPYAAELGVGGPWNLPVRSPEDALDQVRALVASGLRAANFFMLADRDRYFGAPIDVRGRTKETPLTKGLRALIPALTARASQATRVADSVVIIVPRIYSSLMHATWCLGPFAPPSLMAIGLAPEVGLLEDTFGLSGPAQLEWPQALRRLTRALRRVGIAPLLLDGDSAEARLEELRPEQAVLLCHDVIERELWGALRGRADEGLQVFVGPHLPTLDEELVDLEPGPTRELSPPLEAGGGVWTVQLATEEQANEFAQFLRTRAAPRIWTREDEVFVTSHVDENVEVQLVGVINRASRPLSATLETSEPLSFTDLESGEALSGPIELPAYATRLLGVEREG